MTAKKRLAEAVLQEITPKMILGIGTGSTVDCLIELLPSITLPKKIVSSSQRTTKKLNEFGIEPMSLNDAGPLDLYIDGADQVDSYLIAIKGKGGALTLEKILAMQADKFIGLITEDKWVKTFSVPLPVEVLPEARSAVSRALVGLGGSPELRKGITEHGNVIIDVHHLKFEDPVRLEQEIKLIPGVVESGLFSRRRFDKVYIAKAKSIEVIESYE